ncbi:helix-turn-helix domain-containing protein [Corynebacterium camporealensis]
MSTTSTRRRDPATNELYPTWPWPDKANPCAPAHEKIRIAAARLATYVADNALSQRQLAERVGLTHVVIFDFVRGHYWPRTLLIARLETELGIELWPRIGETE